MVSCLAHHVVQLGSVPHVLPPLLPPQLPQHPGSFAPLICPRNVAQPHMQHVEDGGGVLARSRGVLEGLSASMCHPVGCRLKNWLLEEGWLMTRGQQPAMGSAAPAFGSVFWKICFSVLCQSVCPPMRAETVLFTSIPAFTPMLGHRGGFTGGSMVKNPPAMQETQVRSLSGKIPCRRKQQCTPVVLSGKSQGQRSLVGYSPRGRKSLTWLSNRTTISPQRPTHVRHSVNI